MNWELIKAIWRVLIAVMSLLAYGYTLYLFVIVIDFESDVQLTNNELAYLMMWCLFSIVFAIQTGTNSIASDLEDK